MKIVCRINNELHILQKICSQTLDTVQLMIKFLKNFFNFINGLFFHIFTY